MLSEIKRWLDQSKEELDTAGISFSAEKWFAAAFWSQQAAEKALKALYLKEYKELMKVHDLVYLARKLNLPEEIINYCINLSRIYIETRYPDAGGKIPAKKFSKADARNIIKIASEIIKWVEKKL